MDPSKGYFGRFMGRTSGPHCYGLKRTGNGGAACGLGDVCVYSVSLSMAFW